MTEGSNLATDVKREKMAKNILYPEAVFLVMCDPSMNQL
jgi:hypothetical protein